MKQKWMTEEILELVRHKQKMKDRKSLEYRMIGNEVKRQCKIAKETWYNRKCEEIERNRLKYTRRSVRFVESESTAQQVVL